MNSTWSMRALSLILLLALLPPGVGQPTLAAPPMAADSVRLLIRDETQGNAEIVRRQAEDAIISTALDGASARMQTDPRLQDDQGIMAGWTPLTSPVTTTLYGVWGSSNSDVLAVGAGGVILEYDGSNWTEMDSGTDKELSSVWRSSSSDGFAVGAAGTILRYDGGAWVSIGSSVTETLRGVWGASPSDVFAVGDAGTILHYDGSEWSAMHSGSTAGLSDVWGSGPDDVFAVGSGGAILHYDGSEWSAMSGGESSSLYALGGSSGSDVYATSDIFGDLLHYDGNQWSPVWTPGAEAWNGVWVGAENNVVIVGWRVVSPDPWTEGGVIAQYDGNSWTSTDIDSSLYDAWGSGSGDIYTVGSHGTVLHHASEPIFDGCTDDMEIPKSECEALVALYNSTDGDNWTDNTGWLATNTPCSWYGVTCSAGNVSRLDLSGDYVASNNLDGTIPSEIGDLTALTRLDLGINQLSGPIPSEIGNLAALTYLNLRFNQLNGQIPSRIGDLVALQDLFLYGNRLDGSIPVEIQHLTSLRTLDLSMNQLSGSIPPGIGSLTVLETLYLYVNQLTGSIPTTIGQLTALRYLHLNHNQLTGTIPSAVGNLTALVEMGLEHNQLSGEIPTELGGFPELRTLYLGYNQFSGPVPPEIGSLPVLWGLRLDSNPLTGELPADMAALTQLSRFHFDNTDLCVPASGVVPTWLAGIDTLYSTGLVCGQSLGSLSGRVTTLDAAPAEGVQVGLYRSAFEYPYWQIISTTDTIADGTYEFAGLGQGIGIDYRVRFVDPTFELAQQYYSAKPTIATANVITITPGVPRTGIDAVLALPAPPVAGVETETGGVVYNPDGTAQITMPAPNPSDVTVMRAVTCTAGVPSTVTLKLSTGPQYPMANLSGDLYRVIVPALDLTANATLSVMATCGATTTETIVGTITLYDPSGVISDATTEQPVSGAIVTLYEVPGWLPRTGPDDAGPNTCESSLSKDPDALWSQSAPIDLGVIANPEVTTLAPQIPYQGSTVDGYYGWAVPQGCWYVTVTADGYEPLVSPVVGIPPEVTDLDLALTPMTVQTSPAITSADNAAFVVGEEGTFTVTATGNPTPTVTIDGTLPGGVVFSPSSNGTATIAGTPVDGSAGVFALTFTASNGTLPDASQSFTLTVKAAQVEHLVFLPLVLR